MERHQATRSHGICVTIFADYPIISRRKEAVFQKNALHGHTWCVFSREIIPFAPDDSRFLWCTRPVHIQHSAPGSIRGEWGKTVMLTYRDSGHNSSVVNSVGKSVIWNIKRSNMLIAHKNTNNIDYVFIVSSKNLFMELSDDVWWQVIFNRYWHTYFL